jgi:hypothetical protein
VRRSPEPKGGGPHNKGMKLTRSAPAREPRPLQLIPGVRPTLLESRPDERCSLRGLRGCVAMSPWSRPILAIVIGLECGCVLHSPLDRLDPPARFAAPCNPADVTQAFIDSTKAALRAYDGPPADRGAVAVALVVPVPDRSSQDRWTLFLASIDRHRKVIGIDPETGAERVVRLPVGAPSARSVALMPGQHAIDFELWSAGSGPQKGGEAYRRPTTLRGSITFAAAAGGIYSIHACQPHDRKEPLFWVRDEQTLRCISTTCPPTEP